MFAFFIPLAILAAFYGTWVRAKEEDFEFSDIADIFILSVLGGLVAGRVFEFFFSPSRFLGEPLSIFSFWSNPGFSSWGAIIGWGIVSLLIVRRKRLEVLKIYDCLAFGASFFLPIIFVGHIISGLYYGSETSWFWAQESLKIVGRRHPTGQLGLIIFILSLLVISRLARRAHSSGTLALFQISSFSLISFFLEWLRGDSSFERKLINISFSIIAFLSATTVFYLITKRSFRSDLLMLTLVTIKSFGRAASLFVKIIPKRRRIPTWERKRPFLF